MLNLFTIISKSQQPKKVSNDLQTFILFVFCWNHWMLKYKGIPHIIKFLNSSDKNPLDFHKEIDSYRVGKGDKLFLDISYKNMI